MRFKSDSGVLGWSRLLQNLFVLQHRQPHLGSKHEGGCVDASTCKAMKGRLTESTHDVHFAHPPQMMLYAKCVQTGA